MTHAFRSEKMYLVLILHHCDCVAMFGPTGELGGEGARADNVDERSRGEEDAVVTREERGKEHARGGDEAEVGNVARVACK